MSLSENTIELGARVIEDEAARWLERRHFGDWNDAAQSEFAAWMGRSSAHEVAFLRLEAAWGRTGRLAALRGLDADAEKPASSFRAAPILIGIAASLAIVAVVGATAGKYFSASPEARTYATPVGGHETIGFADGTKIELNTNTVLRARMTTDQRLVWLEKGEAYFQVKHDPAHPFVVMVGNHRVTDLGTKFVIQRGAKKVEVALIEGRAWFDRSDRQATAQTALLTPGDEVVATAQSMSLARKPVSELTNELSWRHGMLVFRGTPLNEAAAQFNRYNRQRIVVDGAEVANLRIDGTFPTNGVQVFADAIRNVFGLHIENRGGEVVISRAQ